MKHTFVVEVPVTFGITIEAESLEAAISAAKRSADVKLLHEGESDSDLLGIWCTSADNITEDVLPGHGELTDFHSPSSIVDDLEDFDEVEILWGRTE